MASSNVAFQLNESATDLTVDDGSFTCGDNSNRPTLTLQHSTLTLITRVSSQSFDHEGSVQVSIDADSSVGEGHHSSVEVVETTLTNNSTVASGDVTTVEPSECRHEVGQNGVQLPSNGRLSDALIGQNSNLSGYDLDLTPSGLPPVNDPQLPSYACYANSSDVIQPGGHFNVTAVVSSGIASDVPPMSRPNDVQGYRGSGRGYDNSAFAPLPATPTKTKNYGLHRSASIKVIIFSVLLLQM
jgi:hypothetical protein